jgi:hypothetical protein
MSGLPDAVALLQPQEVDRAATAGDHDKEFLDRAALRADPERRLCCLALDHPRAVALGKEPVRVAGAVAERVTPGLRVHGRALDRVRVPAGGGVGRGVRGRRRGVRGARGCGRVF